MNEEAKKLSDKLLYKSKNCFDVNSAEVLDAALEYSKGYIDFMNNCKTEREAVKYSIALAEKEGFTEYKFGDELKESGNYYFNNRGKALYLFHVGSEDLEKDGIRVTAAHNDSPRVDFKQCPLYEDNEISYFKTHYYGGIKKYQWVTVPLAIHGTVVKADGNTVDICIGEDEGDPVFMISDLLIHLASDQMSKTLAQGITGEQLNVIAGTKPYGDKEVSNRFKLKTMEMLYEKYGITEGDFLSAELCAVPAAKARYIGLDCSLIGAYGHDDKVCVYPELTALFEQKNSKHTLLVVLADKEEIGSYGTTGMQVQLFMDVFNAICDRTGANYAAVRNSSFCLSADVSAAYDPNFAEVFEKNNSAYLNHGVAMCKFTGARGKSGSSDASAEYVGKIRKLLDDAGVVWQMAELGKVDAGGGGTVAMFIAEKGIDTVDLGVPVLSMHAPYEAVSVNDLYQTHLACVAFNK